MPVSADNSGFERPIFIEYHEPAWLGVFRVIMPLGTVSAVLFTALNWPLKLILVCCILAYFIPRLFNRNGGIKQDARVVIVLNRHDEWRIINGCGDGDEATLTFASIVAPDIIFLQLISSGKKCFNLLVTHHCLDQVSMRRLRVRLRYRLKYAE